MENNPYYFPPIFLAGNSKAIITHPFFLVLSHLKKVGGSNLGVQQRTPVYQRKKEEEANEELQHFGYSFTGCIKTTL